MFMHCYPMTGYKYICTILVVLHIYGNAIPIKTNLEVGVGHSLEMDCTEAQNGDDEITWASHWKKDDQIKNICVRKPNTDCNIAVQHNRYKAEGRVVKLNGTCNQITDVQADESGDYLCDSLIGGTIISYLNVQILARPSGKPSVSGSTTIRRGNTVTLVCQQNPLPPGTLNYAWQKNNSDLKETSNTFTKANVQVTDEGSYRCRVKNAGGKGDWSNPVALNVEYAPSSSGPVIDGHASGSVKEVYKGEELSLMCRVSGGGRPAPSIMWRAPPDLQQAATKIGKDTTRELSGMLTKDMNKGECVCIATHHAWNTQPASVKVTLDVLYAPSSPKLTPNSSLPWLEGLNYYVNCNTNDPGNPASSQRWSKGGSPAGTGSRLVMPSVTRIDHGKKLTCTLSNKFTEWKGVYVKSTIDLNIEYKPVIVKMAPVIASENSSVTLTCQATGNPAPVASSYRWYFGGSQHANSATLQLNGLTKHHAGQYMCSVAVQSRGSHGQLSSNKDTTVTVQYLHLIEHNSPQVVTEGEPFKVTCKAEGVPQAIRFFRWDHTGPYVPSHKVGQPVNGTFSSYVVTKAHYKDMGNYTCHVENEVDKKQASVAVTVNFSPKNETHPVDGQVIFTALTLDATLEITVIALPEPVTFTWLKQGKNSDSSEIRNIVGKFKITSNPLMSKLEIMNVTIEDFTNYTVHTDNKVLNGSTFHFELKPKDCPSEPSIDDVFTTAASITATWRPGFNGGYEQTLKVSLCNATGCYQVDHQVEPEYNLPKVTHAQDLEGSTCYDLLVAAHNEHDNKGDGKGCTRQVNQQNVCTKEKPVIPEGTFTVVFSAKSALLIWKRPNVDNYDRQVVEQWQMATRRRRQLVTCTKAPLCNQTDVPVSLLSFTAGVQPGRTYEFRLVFYDGQVPVSSFFARKGIPNNPSSNIRAIAGGVTGVLLAVLVIGVVVLFLLRRRKLFSKGTAEQSKASHDGTTSRTLSDSESATMAHGSSGTYADIDGSPSVAIAVSASVEGASGIYAKPEKNKKRGIISLPQLYAEKQVKKKQKNGAAKDTVECPEDDKEMKASTGDINMKVRQNKRKNQPKPTPNREVKKEGRKRGEKNQKNKKKKAMCDDPNGQDTYENVQDNKNRHREQEEHEQGAYQNVVLAINIQEDEAAYSEVQAKNRPEGELTSPPPGTEGLTYMELEIVRKPLDTAPKPVIAPKPDATVYADVDLTRKANSLLDEKVNKSSKV